MTLVYKAQLRQLFSTLPSRLTMVIERIHQSLDELVFQVPWVLTHPDLSNMNIFVDPEPGHLTGIVDWADPTIEPFGIALWGWKAYLVAVARLDEHTTRMTFHIHDNCFRESYSQRLETQFRMKLRGLSRRSGSLGYCFDMGFFGKKNTVCECRQKIPPPT